MAFSDVKIFLQNGSLSGILKFAEGVAGFIGTGVATANIALGVPKAVYSMSDVDNLLITNATNPGAYKTLREFYLLAGDGAECYIMLVANTMTQAQMWDNTNATGIRVMLNFAQGRIRLAGSFYRPVSAGAVTNAIETDVQTAMTNASVTRLAYAALQTPFRAAIDVRGYTGAAASLVDLNTLTNRGIALVVASTTNDLTSSVGLFIGSLSALPVQRKVSRVKNGALPIPINSAFIGNVLVDNYTQGETMHDKNYIVMRKFAGLGGYYWSGDPSAVAVTDDYCSIARGRVIDKASVLAYAAFVQEIDDDADVDEEGKLLTGEVVYLQTKIEEFIKVNMSGQISAVTAFIDPDQLFLTTNKVIVVLKIKPKGYKSFIEVKLGF